MCCAPCYRVRCCSFGVLPLKDYVSQAVGLGGPPPKGPRPGTPDHICGKQLRCLSLAWRAVYSCRHIKRPSLFFGAGCLGCVRIWRAAVLRVRGTYSLVTVLRSRGRVGGSGSFVFWFTVCGLCRRRGFVFPTRTLQAQARFPRPVCVSTSRSRCP